MVYTGRKRSSEFGAVAESVLGPVRDGSVGLRFSRRFGQAEDGGPFLDTLVEVLRVEHVVDGAVEDLERGVSVGNPQEFRIFRSG